MELELRNLDLNLRHPFTISLGTTTVQRNLMVVLKQDGCMGYEEEPEPMATRITRLNRCGQPWRV